MSYNTFGRHFRITTYGESHGSGIGVVIDGCPSGLRVDEQAIAKDMQRRKPGQSAITTERKENDPIRITSGLIDGVTTGAPIHISIPNTNAKGKDYDKLKDIFRPSHADYTYTVKYGHRDHKGGGRSSARETACRVAAGAIAKQLLHHHGIRINAYTTQIGPVQMGTMELITQEMVELSAVRCPNKESSILMEQHISTCKENGDTCGGIIQCQIHGVPAGLGSPIYDKIEARLAYAMMSINACVGFEIGAGFGSVLKTGSQNNDEFVKTEDGKVRTKTNNSGGIQGGISNGMPIEFNSVFKPVSSITKNQTTVDKNLEKTDVKITGRHDPCVVPRAVPIVEAMAALVTVDFILARRLDQI